MIDFDKKVILASASPRRQELIKLIFDNVEILPADCDETLPEGIGAREAVEYLSKIKNEASAQLTENSNLIISADTVVSVDEEILGKPVDKADAKRMLHLLSGKTHKVITGCAIFKNGRSVSFSETTEVTFYPLTDKEIDDYVDTNEPMDKAGAYGIQGYGSLLIKGINGDYFNVVGLPVAKLNKVLKRV